MVDSSRQMDMILRLSTSGTVPRTLGYATPVIESVGQLCTDTPNHRSPRGTSAGRCERLAQLTGPAYDHLVQVLCRLRHGLGPATLEQPSPIHQQFSPTHTIARAVHNCTSLPTSLSGFDALVGGGAV